MNTPDQNPAPVNPLSGHIHETDDMTVQFASWELQDKLMRTVMAERMTALGITEDHEGDEAHTCEQSSLTTPKPSRDSRKPRPQPARTSRRAWNTT